MVATVRSLLLTRNFLPVVLLVASTTSLLFYAATRANPVALGFAVATGATTHVVFRRDLATLRAIVLDGFRGHRRGDATPRNASASETVGSRAWGCGKR